MVNFSEMDRAFDREHIWHPYTSMNEPLPVYPVVAASGVRLQLDDGRQLIDGMSSWWAAIHGYNHPVLNQALATQTDCMAHVMFGGITHRPAVDLARRLLDLTPAPLRHVFFCDSGSVAVEVAIKMAFQYWFANGAKERSQLLTVRSGYHGDTFQAMSVCDPVTGMHEIFSEALPKRIFAPSPRCRYEDPFDEADFAPMAELAKAHHKQLAAIILEPIVEVAIKMAFQYWFANGAKERSQLLTVRSGYHGDTFQAMSVCDPVTGMHEIFSEALPKRIFAPSPRCRYEDPFDEADFAPMAELAKAHHKQLAAIILEPIVQGAGGMWFYHPEYLRRVRDLCDELDILLIADEIATGFGRSGRMFACEHADIAPDILCLGKALTGGYLSLAATLASTRVAQGISRSELNGGVLMHGPTYMGNPLSCAVACASIDLLLEGMGPLSWQQNVERIHSALTAGLAPCAEMTGVADVRTMGAIGVVEMREPVNVADIQAALVNHGVWVRPFGKLVYLMPPYVMSDEDLATLCGAIVQVVSSVGA